MGNKEEFFHHLPTGLGTQSWHNWTILLLINQAFKSQIELSGTWPRHGYYDYRKALLTRLRNIHWNHTKEVYDQTYHEKNTTFVILLECIIVTRILLIFLAIYIFLVGDPTLIKEPLIIQSQASDSVDKISSRWEVSISS